MITLRRHGGQNKAVQKWIWNILTPSPIHTASTVPPVGLMCLALHLIHVMGNPTACYNWLTALLMFSGPKTFLFVFSINLRYFTACLKTGKQIGSNLELSLNSVVESAKPNLELSQQSSFEMLVWKGFKDFLRCQFLAGEKRRESQFSDWSLGVLLSQV